MSRSPPPRPVALSRPRPVARARRPDLRAHLADFGADVIRIEPPAGVDPNEAMFAADRHGGDFEPEPQQASLTLNLKKPEGLAVLQPGRHRRRGGRERPDVKARLGLTYEDLRAINPRIILASISGFGQDGPYAGRPGFDQIIQGMGGLMSVGHAGGGPLRAPGRGRLRHRHLRGGRHPAGLAGARALGRASGCTARCCMPRSR